MRPRGCRTRRRRARPPAATWSSCGVKLPVVGCPLLLYAAWTATPSSSAPAENETDSSLPKLSEKPLEIARVGALRGFLLDQLVETLPADVAAQDGVVGLVAHRVLERRLVGERVAGLAGLLEVVERPAVVGEDRPAVDLAVHLRVVAGLEQVVELGLVLRLREEDVVVLGVLEVEQREVRARLRGRASRRAPRSGRP